MNHGHSFPALKPTVSALAVCAAWMAAWCAVPASAETAALWVVADAHGESQQQSPTSSLTVTGVSPAVMICPQADVIPQQLADVSPGEAQVPEIPEPLMRLAMRVHTKLMEVAQQQSALHAAQHRGPVAVPVTSLTTSIALPPGALPVNVAAERSGVLQSVIDPRMDGTWADSCHTWAATGLYHRPLLFEEVNLERYGYSPSLALQPVISAGVFMVNVIALPYKVALGAPDNCEYTLGHYRPGSCAPRRWHRTPLRIRPGLAESAVAIWMVFLIP